MCNQMGLLRHQRTLDTSEAGTFVMTMPLCTTVTSSSPSPAAAPSCSSSSSCCSRVAIGVAAESVPQLLGTAGEVAMPLASSAGEDAGLAGVEPCKGAMQVKQSLAN